MKYFVFIFAVCAFAFLSLAKDTPNHKNTEYSKEITVNGMVCAFCSNSLEKKLKKEPAVDKIHVDLKTKKVSVKFKPGKSLSNKELKELITSSGFSVVAVSDASSGSGDKKSDDKSDKR